MKETFYITTAIAYTSQKPHIGNTYEIVFTDAIARFQRLIGKDVFFLTGTDEHGAKIMECARRAGVSEQEYVDRIAGEVKKIWDLMNTSYDKFIRTTDKEHIEAVTRIFQKLYEQGDIYKGEYSGLYCTPCEAFFTESQAPGGLCPDCNAALKQAREEAYFFRISKYQKRLEEHIAANPDFITPESRKKEMVNNFLKPGLQDLCVSRTSFTWGIPVSFDPKHIIYVWIDALSNYITALGYRPEDGEKGALYRKYWPCDVHIIGKDILRFHTIYWPILLMALGEPLPKRVFGHPWFLTGADKMSKSKGNTIYADELASYFGVDAVRFYLLSQMPYAQDGTITHDSVIKVYNAELANTLGNLVSRSVAMAKKYFAGVVPERGERMGPDRELIGAVEKAVAEYSRNMAEFRVSEAVGGVMESLYRANKYIDETMPWVLAKNEADRPRLAGVIYNLLETIRIAAILLSPILPQSAATILSAFGLRADWDGVRTFGALRPGEPIGEIPILFARIDEEEMLERIRKAGEPKAVRPPALPEITIDDFMKTELRAGEVIGCERIKRSEKLLKLVVDLGFEQRQVVSGIARYYQPEELIGKKVIVVINLAPAKLCGTESRGMILAGGEEDIKVVFLDQKTPNGTRIR